MPITRRGAIAGIVGTAITALVPAARAATAARRSFRIRRGGDDVGFHRIALARDGEFVNVTIDIEIVVRLLGIAAYRYAMANREVWRDGRLVSLDCTVNDDGTRKRVQARAQANDIVIESAFYRGAVAANAATTTYFTPDFLRRDTWISTDSGEPYAMSVRRDGTAPVRLATGDDVACARWRATNGSDFDVALFYDARGEWAGVTFDAGGTPATYVPDDLDDRLAAVWQG